MAGLRLPRKVFVGPYTYSIYCNDAATAALGSDFGQCDTERLEIKLSHDKPLQIHQEVLVHEMLHAAMNVAALDVTLGEGIEEDVVRRLAPILTMMIKANPQWIKFITEGV